MRNFSFKIVNHIINNSPILFPQAITMFNIKSKSMIILIQIELDSNTASIICSRT